MKHQLIDMADFSFVIVEISSYFVNEKEEKVGALVNRR